MFDHKLIAIGLGLAMLPVGIGTGWGVKVVTEPCNVQLGNLSGVFTASAPEFSSGGDAMPNYTASDAVVAWLKPLERSTTIDAVILTIDSPGGSAVAGEEMANAIKRFPKPIVAVIRSSGVSAAYWATLGADRIFASLNSQVGSIGATFSYTDSSKKNATEGITYNVVSSGKFKDIGSPDKPLTEEEKALLERDVKIVQNNFITAVASARSLSEDEVKQMADGSFMLGAMAKEKGLIDEIGGVEEARQYLETKLSYAKVCE